MRALLLALFGMTTIGCQSPPFASPPPPPDCPQWSDEAREGRRRALSVLVADRYCVENQCVQKTPEIRAQDLKAAQALDHQLGRHLNHCVAIRRLRE